MRFHDETKLTQRCQTSEVSSKHSRSSSSSFEVNRQEFDELWPLSLQIIFKQGLAGTKNKVVVILHALKWCAMANSDNRTELSKRLTFSELNPTCSCPIFIRCTFSTALWCRNFINSLPHSFLQIQAGIIKLCQKIISRTKTGPTFVDHLCFRGKCF